MGWVKVVQVVQVLQVLQVLQGSGSVRGWRWDRGGAYDGLRLWQGQGQV